MPIVRAEIGESRRLNLRSADAADFYAALLATVPDSFGRFRLQTAHIHVRMYPRREATRASLARVQRRLDELGTGDDPLWQTWVVDTQLFAELTGRIQANRRQYHETPEPPWSTHVCTKYCGKSAAFQAERWGNVRKAAELRLLLNNLGASRAVGRVSDGATVDPLIRSSSSIGTAAVDRRSSTAAATAEGISRGPALAAAIAAVLQRSEEWVIEEASAFWVPGRSGLPRRVRCASWERMTAAHAARTVAVLDAWNARVAGLSPTEVELMPDAMRARLEDQT